MMQARLRLLRWRLVAIVLALCPVVYTLSIGPTYWLMRKDVMAPETYFALNRPLYDLIVAYPSFGYALECYIFKLWEPDPNKTADDPLRYYGEAFGR